MPRATWNGTTLAEATPEQVKLVEGNVYFPPETVQSEYLKQNDQHSVCPWKGTASYYDVVIDGQVNQGAAWYYPEPKQAAQEITDHVAFWKGVEIER